MTSKADVSPALWRWATENGEPHTGSEEDLVRQLASGQVPPYALVWKEGWGEWLPAMQVEELSVAFPVHRVPGTRTARPSSVPGIPPVPVSEYPRLRLLAKETPLGLYSDAECPEREVITSEVPAAALKEAVRAMTEPSPPLNLGLYTGTDRGSGRPEHLTPLLPNEDWLIPPSRPALPLAAEFGLQGLLEQSAPKRSGWPFWLRAHGLWIALGIITFGVGAVFAVRWFGAGPKRPAAPPSATDIVVHQRPLLASAPPLAAAPPDPVCRFRHSPVKLDDWAVVDVRPALVSSPGSKSVAVGYAQSHKHGTGGVIDVESLSFVRKFGQQQERQIFSVTPLSASGAIAYHVERQGALVAFGRALDTVPPLRVGMNDDGFVIGRLDQRSEKVWELPVGTLISVPDVVAHPLGFTLATRAGRTTGQLRLGLLSAAGAALSSLAQVGSAESELGRPALASGPEQTVLAVLGRGDAMDANALLLARAPNGELPLELVPLDLLLEADVELSGPVLAALPDGSFVLMWGQGALWRRQVRVQRLSAALGPIGAVFDVTTPDPALGGSLPGALHWVGDRLLAFYFVRRDEGHSLWVTSFSCAG